MLKIEKNVPIPVGTKKTTGKTLYPLPLMKKGDSFWAPNRHSALSAVAQYKRQHDATAEFTAAIESQGTVNGVRIWKVK